MEVPSSLRNVSVSRIVKAVAVGICMILVFVLVSNVLNRQNMMQNGTLGGFSENSKMVKQKNTRVAGMMGTSGLSAPVTQDLQFDNAPSRGGMMRENTLAQSDVPAVADKKVIKTGDLTLKVASIEKAMDNLRWVAGQFGGDIFSSSVYGVSGNGLSKTGSVTLKVPVAHFDEAMQSIKFAASVVVKETTHGQDVTSEYVDLQARLKNKQEEEESIAAILKRDTNKIDDVLQVTIELARVRGEIEQLQAQMKYLDNQSDMSTITASFTEDTQIGKVDASWRPSQEIKDALNALIKAGQKVLSFLISFVIVLLPILIVLLVIFGGVLYVIVRKLYQWLNR